MKRWTLRITLALLAGAVFTWAVAWGCALWGPYVQVGQRSATLSITDVELIAFSPSFGHRYTLEAGWPMRAMRQKGSDSLEHFSWVLESSHKSRSLSTQLLLALRPSSRFDGVLPKEVIPLGFTLNTLLAAAVILMLTEGAGAWRRRARRNKRRCPACGYDRGGLTEGTACPECGGRA